MWKFSLTWDSIGGKLKFNILMKCQWDTLYGVRCCQNLGELIQPKLSKFIIKKVDLLIGWFFLIMCVIYCGFSHVEKEAWFSSYLCQPIYVFRGNRSSRKMSFSQGCQIVNKSRITFELILINFQGVKYI